MNEIRKLKFDAEYASEVMNEIPAGYINKTICGCGLTTLALENNVDTVIAVPTIYLVENKAAQYPNKRYSGKVLAVTGETSSEDIAEYVNDNFKTDGRLKIISTYDSLPKLEPFLHRCKLVIDESNELLSKTKLKPVVINRVFEIAKKYKESVSFVSATPTPLEYMPDWISELDQVTIEWSKTVKTKAILFQSAYPYKTLRQNILVPLKENGRHTVKGRTFNKVIVFINSIDQIIKTIKDAGLKKEDCGIICGDSLKNDIKIRGIKRYVLGKMPKYLFITSSGFAGIDLNDKESMTIVVSCTRRSFQMIDMLTDLKQAVSRQRNKENPNYGSYIYIYNQTVFKKPEGELIQKLDEVYDSIVSAIRLYEYGVENECENGFFKSSEFNLYTVFKNGTYEINEQAFLADRYFILEIRNQYTKGFDVLGQFDEPEFEEEIIHSKDITYTELVEHFENTNINGRVDWGIYGAKKEWIELIETSYKLYKKTWKDQSYAKNMIANYGDGFTVTKQAAARLFKKGEKYTRKDIKNSLQKLYEEQNISRTAKATDLFDIFKKVEPVKVNGGRGLKIVEK